MTDVPSLLDLATLSSTGCWPIFHMLAENFMSHTWLPDRYSETMPAVLVLHAYETVLWVPAAKAHPAFGGWKQVSKARCRWQRLRRD